MEISASYYLHKYGFISSLTLSQQLSCYLSLPHTHPHPNTRTQSFARWFLHQIEIKYNLYYILQALRTVSLVSPSLPLSFNSTFPLSLLWHGIARILLRLPKSIPFHKWLNFAIRKLQPTSRGNIVPKRLVITPTPFCWAKYYLIAWLAQTKLPFIYFAISINAVTTGKRQISGETYFAEIIILLFIVKEHDIIAPGLKKITAVTSWSKQKMVLYKLLSLFWSVLLFIRP